MKRILSSKQDLKFLTVESEFTPEDGINALHAMAFEDSRLIEEEPEVTSDDFSGQCVEAIPGLFFI